MAKGTNHPQECCVLRSDNSPSTILTLRVLEGCKRRERERAVEHWMESASMSSRGVGQAEREAQRAREAASRLESDVKRLSNSLADLNGSYR